MRHLILKLLLIAAVAWPSLAIAQQTVNEVKHRDAKPALMLKKNASLSFDKVGKSITEFTPQATYETAEMQSKPGAQSASSGMHHRASFAPTPKAGSKQIYDYYDELLMPNSQVSESNNYVNLPIRGASLNARCEGQMIYGKSLLGGLQNGDIIYAIAFYASTDITPIGENENSITLRVGNTTTSTYTNSRIANQMTTLRSSLSSVYTGALPIQSNSLYFEFSEPIIYTGNNLVVDLVRNSGDYAQTIYWYSTLNQGNVSAYNYGTNGASRSSTLPAMRVYYKRAHTATVADRTIAVKDSTFFKDIEYQWTNGEGTHTSNLTEIATDPDQMIALVREVYTNKSIPGNLKRGFAADGTDANQVYQDVYYSGVGGINLTGQYVDEADSYEYVDSYGWGIPGNIADVQLTEQPLATESYTSWFSTYYRYTLSTYTHLDLEQYKPNEEGLTLLLVELKEDYVDGSNDAIEADETSYSTEYDRLRAYFENTVKSVRVLNEAKRMGSGLEAGTLFKIDCDKMNKFFLLAKGQLNLDNNSMRVLSDFENTDFSPAPSYFFLLKYDNGTQEYDLSLGNNGSQGFFDVNASELFYHMFEQFSPVANDATAGMEDIYQSLINMDSFGVKHDCIGITQMNHQFLMYGPDSKDADCQDVRDMMFFVPDYRMLEHSSRGSSIQRYHNYHPDMQPTMGLYVIRQNEITPTTEADNYYMLNLNWVTNLDDFLPGEDQEFELLQVVVNEETGIEEYVPVYYMNENGEYTDANGNVVSTPVPIVLHLGSGAEKNYPDVYVARQVASQQVTYAIRGRDAEGFLNLQISNRQSYIVPGTDPQELVSLVELAHYSRYNPENEENCYSNRFKMSNNVGGLTRNNMSSAQNTQNVFTFTRKTSSTDQNPVTIATATVTNRTSSGGTITVVMQNQDEETEFPKAMNSAGYAGYHANPGDGTTWTQNFTYKKVNGVDYVDFGDFVLCDNFIVDVSKNEHPNQYIYEVKFNLVSTDDHNFDEAHGSAFRVPIYKTATQINGSFTQNEVDRDNGVQPTLGVPENVEFGVDVQYSSITEILRYDAYRWNEGETRYIVDEVGDNDSEQDLPPTGLCMNHGEYYTISMNPDNDDYEGYETNDEVSVSSGTTTTATFVDDYAVNNVGAYVYAPVVETFTTGKDMNGNVRRDYNTYGGPLQSTATGVFSASVVEDQAVPNMSEYTWTVGDDVYTYYNVFLQFNTAEVPAGYELYKVRVWRQAQRNLLGEKAGEGYESRIGTDIGSGMNSIKYEEITHGTDEECTMSEGNSTANVTGITNYMLGKKHPDAANQLVWNATFGARKVRNKDDETGVIEELPLKFIVRAYFTRNENLPAAAQPAGAPRRAEGDAQGDGKFYIVQQEIDYVIKNNNIVTAVDNIAASRQVSEVVYYDMAGKASSKPYNGVNVMVTRYTDGTVTTAKVVK